MPNELLWLIMVLIDFFSLILVFRLFGKNGLYAAITISIILCNIQVLKIVDMFGLVVTLGNILYGSIFLATDILNELYGKKEARKGVWIGFYALIFTTIIMQLALQFTPAADDFIDPSLQQIFGFLPRVAMASMIAYAISQSFDVWLFSRIKIRTKGRKLWFRNNASTMLSQMIDTLTFCTIAFYGIFPLPTFIEIALTTYIFKWFVALIDTPFIYWAKRIAGLPAEIKEQPIEVESRKLAGN
jgi:queuosine precursor transporter